MISGITGTTGITRITGITGIAGLNEITVITGIMGITRITVITGQTLITGRLILHVQLFAIFGVTERGGVAAGEKRE